MSDRLTIRSIEAIKPAGRDVFAWDGALHGFGVRVKPSGRKSFVLQYRTKSGLSRRMTLGEYNRDAFRPEDARKLAGEYLRAVRLGGDPAADEDAARKAPTVAEFAETYLSEWAGHHKKPRSADEDRRNLKLHVIPALGSKKLADVPQADVVKLFKALSVNRKRRQVKHPETGEPMTVIDERPTPVRANRVLALLSKMFSLAETAEFGSLRPPLSNPCRGLRKHEEAERERYLSSEEAARLADALSEAERTGTVPLAFVQLVRLLMLTGARLGEILHLQWEHVDFERQMIFLPDSKTGRKPIYLNAPATEVLSGIARVEGNPFVIVGRKPGGHFVGVQHAWQRLRRKAGFDDLRLHDLRHNYASALAGKGYDLLMIGKLLGHRKTTTTQRYAHLAADPVKAAAEKAGAAIVAAMAGKSAEILPLAPASTAA